MKHEQIQLERMILALAIWGGSAQIMLKTIPNPDPFTDNQHKILYQAVANLVSQNKPIDPILLAPETKRIDNKNASTLTEIGNLCDQWPPSQHEAYIRELVDRYRLSRIEYVTRVAHNKAHEQTISPNELLSDLTGKLYPLSESQTNGHSHHISNNLVNLIGFINDCQTGKIYEVAVFSGINAIDNKLFGFKPGCSYILAGQTSHGKTQLGVQIALNAAKKDKKVTFLSLEMSKLMITLRFLCTLNHIDVNNIYRKNGLSTIEWEIITRSQETFSRLPIRIAAPSGLTVPQLSMLCQQEKTLFETDLFIIDQMKFVNGGTRFENKTIEIDFISQNLKALSKQLDTPIITLHQLHRKPAGMTEKPPVLSELRGSGSIEQDADGVIFVYLKPDKNRGQIDVAKHRDGHTGKTPMAFVKGRWEELETKHEPMPY